MASLLVLIKDVPIPSHSTQNQTQVQNYSYASFDTARDLRNYDFPVTTNLEK